ncbi:unnamed protein product [Cyprideis torosa]|uniref:Uncharacterized protein n=1 Tax=Cyprideis torosa TaxID=163714 RepID=A0A7R8ZN29_9CRUS|nr:unnamed protein product [Cyprideis torosa]CAG0890475.1 unnamed protein product [Cyprideis torosa]
MKGLRLLLSVGMLWQALATTSAHRGWRAREMFFGCSPRDLNDCFPLSVSRNSSSEIRQLLDPILLTCCNVTTDADPEAEAEPFRRKRSPQGIDLRNLRAKSPRSLPEGTSADFFNLGSDNFPNILTRGIQGILRTFCDMVNPDQTPTTGTEGSVPNIPTDGDAETFASQLKALNKDLMENGKPSEQNFPNILTRGIQGILRTFCDMVNPDQTPTTGTEGSVPNIPTDGDAETFASQLKALNKDLMENGKPSEQSTKDPSERPIEEMVTLGGADGGAEEEAAEVAAAEEEETEYQDKAQCIEEELGFTDGDGVVQPSTINDFIDLMEGDGFAFRQCLISTAQSECQTEFTCETGFAFRQCLISTAQSECQTEFTCETVSTSTTESPDP